MIVALRVWKQKIADRPIVIFVDNNSARDVAISGTARTKVPLLLVAALLALEDEIPIYPWYARVPSKSNPADEPSRRDGEMDGLGVRKHSVAVADAVQWSLAKL